MTAAEVIALLGLAPLPGEGGFYREIYRGADTIAATALPARYAENRASATAIYFLVTPQAVSKPHRLPTDELYFHLAGDPLEMLLLTPGEAGAWAHLGKDFAAGERPQLTVPRDTWMASRPKADGPHGYSLVSTVMAPGFEFADMAFPAPGELEKTWPTFAAALSSFRPGA